VKGSDLNISNENYQKEKLSTVIGSNFILIPAGTFLMGSPAEEPERSADEQQHQVTISKPFYMQTTQVNQRQWKAVMRKTSDLIMDDGDDYPAIGVSWNNAQKYIEKLNQKEGTDKFRLPTEAEWEYAARSGGLAEKYAGTGSDTELGDYAWYEKNSGFKIHTVGQKKPNSLGLYDMSGNVWEWCQDFYMWYYTPAYPPKGSKTDPIAEPPFPWRGFHRVLRGGTWCKGANACRSASRFCDTPHSGSLSVGFRLVRTL